MPKLIWRNSTGFGIILIFVACNVLVTSCVSIKKAKYFSDLPDTISAPLSTQAAPFVDPKIESNDILAITIQTVTQNLSNTPITTNSVATFNPLNGNLVDKNGNIELPLIGIVKVAGLTTAEARELVEHKADKFYNNPVVNLRIANFDIFILGEVNKPGSITMPSEKVSIIDAITLSGDLPLTAKRHNVLLIRSKGDEKEFVRLDLTSKDIFQSPYFYLRQRDIIYVEPNKGKIQASDNTIIRNLGILSSFISLVSLLLVFKSIK
jgi:polysaccharide biosynthesis/export protein